MELAKTTIEQLHLILAADGLEGSERLDLATAFFVLNPLEFARKLHGLTIPEHITSQLLALKVAAPSGQTFSDAGMQNAVSFAMNQFWQRLSDPKALQAAIDAVNQR
jgi:hypothetical protein